MNIDETCFGDAIRFSWFIARPATTDTVSPSLPTIERLAVKFREPMTSPLAAPFRRHGIVQDPKTKAL